MPVPHFPKRYADVVARLRVPSGFLLVGTFAWLAAPSPQSLAIGLPLSIAGLLLRGWAAGHLAKNRSLATSGPYGHLRNPLYLGTLTVAAGLVIAAQRWLLAGIFGAVFLFIYLPVIELEEQHLRRLFPEYAKYAERVPALLPCLGFRGGAGRFHWSLYRKNQEFQALAGLLAGAAYLAWRALG
ncbi:MAG: isoprenylcysteine carboxylmethyltransferase family protein [Acidobacteria bacterium]|nr:isoprenylcysteine carboxylmethyltransferase family protein [Acidobacteriota bacterium]